ncbi:MAG: hypothetical protein MR639_02070 [Clostridium sp.]|uniref:hypothetical protein n=1 Tax=Clostridium sp. TaxID=1506 RepID=UPI002A900AAB|nr:hypothetical protein [Clostridium sp.]MDY5097400.1 hypothetical protein [Clostridium sp.]
MKINFDKKKSLVICLLLVVMTLLMDSRFYLDYLFHKNDYIAANGIITNINFYPSGKSGSYQSTIEYYFEDKLLTENIRTALGDSVGKEITIAINKSDSTKILPNNFKFEKKTAFHSIFMGAIFIYDVYLIIELILKKLPA